MKATKNSKVLAATFLSATLLFTGTGCALAEDVANEAISTAEEELNRTIDESIPTGSPDIQIPEFGMEPPVPIEDVEGTPEYSSDEAAVIEEAKAVIDSIPVKGRAPKTGYDRDNFGSAWADVDRNGCDTRNDILQRDLTDETFKDGTKECVVATGVLQDKYTGTTINFVRGQDTSSEVQIDHLVALSNAWQTGAQQLSEDERKQFSNDPLNLMASDGSANMQKGDADAATWLPANKDFRCEYVSLQTLVKDKYELWMTQAEKDAISGILASC